MATSRCVGPGADFKVVPPKVEVSLFEVTAGAFENTLWLDLCAQCSWMCHRFGALIADATVRLGVDLVGC
ncbi:hypothetical protein PsAD14_01240 [Pseudovibrio sp. Ad14]|nr:hypothetical protein PsW74_05445 [Pseudovibrio sp. W74]KZL10768.1 hypothetical protein PsAD14_01240 [Pseudovibrio sp. Ad14]